MTDLNFTLDKRKLHIATASGGCGFDDAAVACDKPSVAGSVSQRACTFCGSRVVLYPISDALHLVHGPVGCASYTWDIRGSLSSGSELNRMSFCTDLREHDVIHGGAGRLRAALRELITEHKPAAAFIYSTCIAGLIGDDIDAVCREVQGEFDIPILNVQSEGFKGTKKDGYRAACDTLAKLVGTDDKTELPGNRCINLLGEFNIAGETWMIQKHLEEMGVQVLAGITGDGRVADIRRAHRAQLNVVQCSGSMMSLAKQMQVDYGVPYIRVSFFGMEDTAMALYDIARHFKDDAMLQRTRLLVRREVDRVSAELAQIRVKLEGKRAAVYVGGSFKAISLIRALRQIGVKTVLVGSQTGNADDYAMLQSICDEGTIIVDDSNPRELSRFSLEQKADLFIGGVKERPMAYKMGMGFCDHNHERKIPLAGFEGMLYFAREVQSSLLSPVWRLAQGAL
jgi:nitrogenase molybdenum-cofactor synthesis protein NifE